MKKFLLLFLSILMVFSFITCKKSSNKSSSVIYYFRGTVYLRNNPAPDVVVNMGFRDSSKIQGGQQWDENKQTKTDSNGKYEFTIKESFESAHGWTWKVRALHPETGNWTDWIMGGTVTPGENGAGTIDIYLE
ncbi:hypothetical protein DRQ09_08245 [candidate division KSB1 bacterium]|nr:MAG: hypothetical protein DRQ09_08245 [candidate division KSB1 bacterium]